MLTVAALCERRLRNVSVVTDRRYRGATFTVDGQFALPEPPPGNYTLQFVHRKAGSKLVPVILRPSKRLVVNVTVDLADPAKSEATVTEE